MTESTLPQSKIEAKKPLSWWLFVPVIVAFIIIALIISSLGAVGPRIQISFPEGHGLKIGDSIKYRGIIAGEVSAVRFNQAHNGIQVDVTLHADAAFLARSESRFWIVRPTLSFSKVSGADTIIGARYIAVAPGEGETRTSFAGLAEEPPILERKPDALEIICQSDFRSGLRAGAPVMYRQVVIGRVLSVELASDGSAIESRMYIEPRSTSLIRANTEFWNASGFTFSGGIFGGLELSIDSLETLITGGIALAVPNQPGKQAINGDRFILHAKPDEDWLTWNPSIELSNFSRHLYNSDIPNVISTKSHWQESGFWGSKNNSAQAYAIATQNGLLGIESLMPASAPNIEFHIDDNVYHSDQHSIQAHGLILRPMALPFVPWPRTQMRVAQQIEDSYAIKSSDNYKHIPVSKITKNEHTWTCDVRDLNKSWNGCPVISVTDKKIIGFLSVTSDGVVMVPLSTEVLESLD